MGLTVGLMGEDQTDEEFQTAVQPGEVMNNLFLDNSLLEKSVIIVL